MSALLEQAQQSGEVRIRRADGQTFVLKPENEMKSPLDIQSVDLGISERELWSSFAKGANITKFFAGSMIIWAKATNNEVWSFSNLSMVFG